MAIGAHADDIEIQVGGTLEKYHKNGYAVIYVMSTNNMSGIVTWLEEDGTVGRKEEPTDLMMARRKRECDAAAAEFGTTPIHLDHPQRHYTDENLESQELRYGSKLPSTVPENVPSILTAWEHKESIQKLADLMIQENPECIFTHGPAQKNLEHSATCLLVTNAYWQAVERGFKGGLLYWVEEHSHHGPSFCRWDTFIDYTPFLGRKMELIGIHKCQMPKAHFPDYGHRLVAILRGKACGVGAAEVFHWVNRPSHYTSNGPVFTELVLELIQNTR